MRFFSTFSGIGGFELGIQLAYERLFNNSDITRESQTEGELFSEGEGTSSEDSTMSFNGGKPSPLVCVGYSEIDKYAIQVYQQHFPNHTNYGDITKINADTLPDFDLLVGGFPCQSFSIAGKRGGFEDTRGTLFFDLARILRAKRPRLFLFENVKGLLSHDNGRTFSTIISTLDELGYDLQWQVLNSKNHGVPQNRERVFIVGHLRGTPRPEVFPFGESNEEYAKGLIQLNTPKFSSNRIYDKDGISPNIRTMQGGNLQPKVWLEPKIRRLTPIECERLQGFPDNWTAGISDTQRYKCCGNAVTVNVIRDIISKIL